MARAAVACNQRLMHTSEEPLCVPVAVGLDKFRVERICKAGDSGKLKPLLLFLANTAHSSDPGLRASAEVSYRVISRLAQLMPQHAAALLSGAMDRLAYQQVLLNDTELKKAGCQWTAADFDSTRTMDYGDGLPAFIGMSDELAQLVRDSGLQEDLKLVYKLLCPFDATDIMYDDICAEALLSTDPQEWPRLWSYLLAQCCCEAGGAAGVDLGMVKAQDLLPSRQRQERAMALLKVAQEQKVTSAHSGWDQYRIVYLLIDTEGDDLRAVIKFLLALGAHRVKVFALVPSEAQVQAQAQKNGDPEQVMHFKSMVRYLLKGRGFTVVEDPGCVNARAIMRTATALFYKA